MTADTDHPALHEFEPYPLTPSVHPAHTCGRGCACWNCGIQKGDWAVHYQARDRRRPKVTA